MRLSRLIGAGAPLPLDPEITGICADSREAAPGCLFAALSGSRAQGQAYVADAVARGAVAVLAEPGAVDAAALAEAQIALVEDATPRRRLSLLAAAFFGRQPAHVVAVTGTNGKTSTAEFVRRIWAASGRRAASLGTLGAIVPDAPELATGPGLTTPDAPRLHRLLAALHDAGIDHLAMEASSHGLDQHRLDGVRLEAAAFTNLSRDHLDYHADMAAYLAAKSRLFADLLPASATAVLNADVPEFAPLRAIAQARGQKLLAYGRQGADIRLVSLAPTPEGQTLELEILGARRSLFLPLAGAFQAANALAALGLALASGVALEAALDALARLEGVPGRLQRAATLNGASVYVDYAHTPDALETVLRALKSHCTGHLVAVMGCGGDRDAGKRPLMGAVAARLADATIVTDDNPRSEDPAAIRAQVMAGVQAGPGKVREIGDREDAIAAALESLEPGDILLVAGKGHEQGQIVGGVTHPFDDVAVVRRLATGPAAGERANKTAGESQS